MGGRHLNLGFLYPGVTNLGPGRRVGLWVRGCSLGCPGCLAPDLVPREPANPVDLDDVCREITVLAGDHDGLTVSGGEPFEQAAPLRELVRRLRRSTDLDFLVYSGFTLEEITAHGGDRAELLAEIDMLIDGRFREELPGTALYRGSDNQVLHLLTRRAKERYADLPGARYETARPLRFFHDPSGRLRLIGIPERGFARRFDRLMAARGLDLMTAPIPSERGED